MILAVFNRVTDLLANLGDICLDWVKRVLWLTEVAALFEDACISWSQVAEFAVQALRHWLASCLVWVGHGVVACYTILGIVSTGNSLETVFQAHLRFSKGNKQH
jgi:hypothetical protein